MATNHEITSVSKVKLQTNYYDSARRKYLTNTKVCTYTVFAKQRVTMSPLVNVVPTEAINVVAALIRVRVNITVNGFLRLSF